MKIVVPLKLVPDLVEELEIAASGAELDTSFSRLLLNEFDEHALEQALLLKERSGAEVTALTAGIEGADEVLYNAAAKGADRLVKLSLDFPKSTNSHAMARLYGTAIRDLGPDLVLVGVQAHDSLDGPIGPMLAEVLGMPYVGYVAGLRLGDGCCVAKKEYPGGVTAEVELDLPAVQHALLDHEHVVHAVFSRLHGIERYEHRPGQHRQHDADVDARPRAHGGRAVEIDPHAHGPVAAAKLDRAADAGDASGEHDIGIRVRGDARALPDAHHVHVRLVHLRGDPPTLGDEGDDGDARGHR